MRDLIARDAEMFFCRWEASRKPRWMLWGRLFLLTPGFQLVFSLRLQRALVRLPVIGAALRRILWYFTTLWFSCDVDPEAEIGPGLYVPHPLGIVITGSVRIGANVSLLQNVTLGRIGTAHRDPVIGNDVEIGAGAAILGPHRIGSHARIGANSVVLDDVPASAVAVGNPARIVGAAA